MLGSLTTSMSGNSGEDFGIVMAEVAMIDAHIEPARGAERSA